MATKKTAKVKKMDGFSADVRQEKLDALKQLVPEAFADEKIDIKRLRKLIGEDVVTEDERYRLEWSGKAEVFDEIAERSSCTLTLDQKRSSKDWKDSNNIFIEGENLEVLRTLQKAYSGKVKMIYIDPPYNTGKDFVYNDNFRETEEEYCEDECNIDENGLLKKAYKLNSRDGGRFHSNWLSMMYPRLYLARNLLCDEGVVFVSIDDNEIHNLRIIMDEIFGEQNFVQNFMWLHGKGKKDKNSRTLQQYILCYAKKKELLPEWSVLKGKNYNFTNPDNDPEGPWFSGSVSFSEERSNRNHDNYFALESPSGVVWERQWQYSKEEMEEFIQNRRIYWGTEPDYSNVPRLKIRPGDTEEVIPENIIDNVGTTKSAQTEVEDLIGFNAFDYPKPIELIRHLINLASEDGDLIVDFFAGSGTTAHAVALQNALNNESRKYICIQIPEETPLESEARNAGYKNISDIAIDRIKNALTKIKSEQQDFEGDLDVRVYKETESHFPQWHSQVFKSDKDLEQAMIDYSKAEPEGTPFDRATEVLLKLGYPLTTEITEKDGYMLAAGEVALVLDTKFQVKNLQKVLDAAPKTVVVLEKIFKKDQDKINFALRCKEAKVIFQTV